MLTLIWSSSEGSRLAPLLRYTAGILRVEVPVHECSHDVGARDVDQPRALRLLDDYVGDGGVEDGWTSPWDTIAVDRREGHGLPQHLQPEIEPGVSCLRAQRDG